MRFKRILSFIFAVIMFIGALPLDLVHAQESFTVERIEIYKNFNSLTNIATYRIAISGTGLNTVSIGYHERETGTFIPLTNPEPGSDGYFRQYSIDPGVKISAIRVGNKRFEIDETSMPMIDSIEPSKVDLSNESTSVTIKGRNFTEFDSIGGTTTIWGPNNKNLTDKFEGSRTGEVVLNYSSLLELGYGNISFSIVRKEKIQDDQNQTDLIITYNQNNAFRIYRSMNIPKENITIYPNRGTVGSEVTITIDGFSENYSVFFLKEETDPFIAENMGEDPYYPTTTDDKSIIKVKVPKGLEQGRTYKVVLTNNLDNVKKPNSDLTKYVTKQQTIGEFYVVEAGTGPAIIRVEPNEGTSAGSYVTIYGRRFEELNITGLNGKINPVNEGDLDIESSGIDDPTTRLKIDYKLNDKVTYNNDTVTSITRSFLVTIGGNAKFEEDHKAKNIFQYGSDKEDQLYVKTPTINEDQLKDPVKDVVIEITTKITTDKGEYTFIEVISLADAYTYLPSYQDPVIEKVAPDKIQVESENNPATKRDTVLSIQGKNFNVFRYLENGEYKTNYPKVVIGGTDESGQIVVERKEEGKVYYTYKDGSGIVTKEIPNAIFEVLNENGSIVTGIGGNEVGNSIVLTIPKGINVSASILNKPLPVAVANPKRDSADKGLYSSKQDLITFVVVDSEPSITEVNPYIVTVDGGEEIVVKGINFKDGIKVFIDGKEITDVKRDIDKITTNGTLVFNAPKGREGETVLQVMNPDGGSATHPFIYVETMRIDPIINSIAPSKGTKDTLVVIKGNNFLKPDQTAEDTGFGFYRLIGTTILLDGEDVNTYNKDKKLAVYTSPEVTDKTLLKVEKDPWTNKERLTLSPYYKNVSIKDENSKSYSVYVNYEGYPVISGKENTYTFQLAGETIIAVDKDGKEYTVDESTNGKLLLTDSDENNIEFEISFDYKLFSIGEDEFGNKYLRVADYYDSIFLKYGDGNYAIEVDDLNRVTLSDGKSNTYEITLHDGKFYAVEGSNMFEITVNNDSIEFDNKTFTFTTPYYVDPSTGVITGHRAKVKNKNEIWVTIPEKHLPGLYDVTVRNPDTKSHTVKDGFEYFTSPKSKPIINYINPSQGSVDGGYDIVIYGEGFEDTTQVYIAGVKVPEEDITVNKIDYKSITVKVPKYPGNQDEDFITDKKFVPVVVVNEDGGSYYRDDLFAYVIASSRPRIESIMPVKGTAAGGDIVEIRGYDFRFYEPYKGQVPSGSIGDYEDIDRNGEWTNMKTEDDCEAKLPLDHPIFKEYCASPVLPRVYFGKELAKIVEFHDGFIKVVTPRSSMLGQVDVYIVNNDAGTSNKVKFTYEGSNPKINTIVPNTGKKQGGEKIDILGVNFKPVNINVYNQNGQLDNINTYLVRFGQISNRNLPIDNDNYGQINNKTASVSLAGGLTVEYDGLDISPIVKVTLTESNKIYTGQYIYSQGAKYIDLKSLKDSEGNNYPGFELVKVEVADGRLLVDRGYSPEAKLTYKDQLEVLTPSYYTVGNVNVVVENPDGISNSFGFLYKNPASKPEITNITRDGQDPQEGDDQNILILPVHYQGGSIITIEGLDFRENAIIQIGDVLTINPKDIQYNLPTKLTFTMPPVSESALGRLHKVVVINEDGGTASSDKILPKPIYIQFIKGESNPAIETIFPDRGPARGGTQVTITGKDFRETMEGFEGKRIKVYFGEVQVPDEDVEVIDYKTIVVKKTPPGSPGRVEVKVENPDGSISRPSGYFIYISGPVINRVEDPLTGSKITHISVKGGQEIKLIGEQFMEGAKVIFSPVIRKASPTDTGEIINIDGEAYVLEGGVPGTNFKYIDDKTVLITTPEGKIGETGVMIINPDKGASPIYELIYDLPGIDAPEEVEAELVFDRYIRVHFSPVSGADFYEIYVLEDTTREDRAEFIGSTDSTSFLFKDIEPKTTYRFIVKAVGEFGSSESSRMSNAVKTGRNVGYSDEDGDLGEYTTIDKTGNVLNISLGYRDFDGLKVDLNKNEYKGAKEIIISIPLKVVFDANAYDTVTVFGEDFSLSFNPRVFQSSSYSKYKGEKDAGIKFRIYYNTGNTNLNSYTSLSNQLVLEGDFYRGKESQKINYLMGSMSLTMDYQKDKADLRRIDNIHMYYYDTSNWKQVSSSVNKYYGQVSGNINNLGRYAILGYRR